MAYTEDFHSNDLPNIRTYQVDNNVLRATRTDPFGFVYLSYERGTLPEELKSAYTSFWEADLAVKAYLERRNAAKSTIDKNTKAA